jgi:hypothetical protein
LKSRKQHFRSIWCGQRSSAPPLSAFAGKKVAARFAAQTHKAVFDEFLMKSNDLRLSGGLVCRRHFNVLLARIPGERSVACMHHVDETDLEEMFSRCGPCLLGEHPRCLDYWLPLPRRSRRENNEIIYVSGLTKCNIAVNQNPRSRFGFALLRPKTER